MGAKHDKPRPKLSPQEKERIKEYLEYKLQHVEAGIAAAVYHATGATHAGAWEQYRYWKNVKAAVKWLLDGLQPKRAKRNGTDIQGREDLRQGNG